HAFKCPGRGDIRSVCPALNTLANHSYIPHDGRNISFSVLSRALQAGYGISPAFAQFLVLGGYILLRRNVLNPLDLHEIGLHNRIEHNASVVHADDVNGSKLAPTHVDPVLLHKFLTKAYSPPSLRSSEGDRVVTIQDIAYTRTAREIEAIVPPDAIHAEIARGEFAMVLDIFGRDPEKTLSGKDLGMWLNENRFPPGWAPAHQEGLLDTISESKKMRTLMDAYRGEE
ncbi:Cloroperoxidase, partial [Ramaria rubella]